MKISRRGFVFSVSASAALGYAVGAYQTELVQLFGEPLFPIEKLARDWRGATGIGDKYLSTAQATPAQLRSLLEARLGSTPGIADLERAIGEDFAQGRLCEVDGWQLAQTECWVAALSVSVEGGVTADAVPARSFENAPEGQIAELVSWGPTGTLVGEGFNVQPDGHFGNWFKFGVDVPDGVAIYLAGRRLITTHHGRSLTTSLYPTRATDLLGEPGELEFWLYDEARHLRQRIGSFLVQRSPADVTACEVENWGPRETVAGQPFNQQPGGASAFWFRTDCAFEGATIYLDDNALKTTANPAKGVLTARVETPMHWQTAGKKALELELPGNTRRFALDTFVVTD